MKSKSLDQYQAEVKKLVKRFELNWSTYVRYIHLVEEIGELGESITVNQGDREAGSGEEALADHADIKEEFGDVLFGVIDLADHLGISTAEVMEDTFKRYEKKLAKKGMKLGEEKSKWLYAATMDRWLLSSGKAQKYGTQFKRRESREIEVAKPIDSRITDEERKKYNVPSLSEAVSVYKKKYGLE